MVDLGFTSTKKVASEGGNWFAMMSDIDKALKKMADDQYNIIRLRFYDGLDTSDLASELQVSDDAARMRINRALNSLLNLLGGSRPRKERDYKESEIDERPDDLETDVGDLGDEAERQELD